MKQLKDYFISRVLGIGSKSSSEVSTINPGSPAFIYDSERELYLKWNVPMQSWEPLNSVYQRVNLDNQSIVSGVLNLTTTDFSSIHDVEVYQGSNRLTGGLEIDITFPNVSISANSDLSGLTVSIFGLSN